METTKNPEGCRMKNPAHPALLVRDELLAQYGLSVTESADILGVTRQALSTFLNERSSLSPEMALRIELAFGLPADLLMRMQCSYDIAQLRLSPPDLKVKRYEGKLVEAIG